jgi:hypothetical protein
MHFLALFLKAWLAIGTVTVFFLFWLCKRTAATVDGSTKFSPHRAELRDSRAA